MNCKCLTETISSMIKFSYGVISGVMISLAEIKGELTLEINRDLEVTHPLSRR